MVTLFEPYCTRIQSAFGKFIPIAVEGYSSPPNMAAQITLAITPLTCSFLKRLSTGEWSSNHCALSDIIRVLRVASSSLYSTSPSQVPFNPSGSPYTSIKPLIKSTVPSCSFSHSILYWSKSFKSPVS